MAFPVVAARITGRTTNTNTTTHAITLPAGVVAGNLLVVVFSVDGNPTVTAQQAGWTKLNQASNGTVVTGAVFWKAATGSDALTLTTSASEASSHASFRITNGGTPTATSAVATSTNSNPPAHTPPAGSRDYLWIATRAADSTNVATAAPTNYANLQTQAATGTNGASVNTAERSLTAAAEDPGTFTSATSIGWQAWTISVPPADQTAVPVALASTGSVGLPTVAIPQTRVMAPVVATPTVGAPTVATHYAVSVASGAQVFTPPAAKTTTVPALLASSATVAPVTTTLTATLALVASTASVATPVVIGEQMLTAALVVNTSTVATPAIATRYPLAIGSTAAVAAPTVATHYPILVASTAVVAPPKVTLWLRPVVLVNQPAALAPSSGLAPSATLLPSAGGDRFFPPSATVNLAQTHLPTPVNPESAISTPAVEPGGVTVAIDPVASAASVGAPTLDTVTLYRYPRTVTRALTPSPNLAPSADLAPAAVLSTVFAPTAWLGVPQTVAMDVVASTATVATPGLPATTLHPRTVTRALAPSPTLIPSTNLLVSATGLAQVHSPVGNTAVHPAFVPGLPQTSTLYPGPDLYPSPELYPGRAQTPAPSVRLGVVTLTPATIPTGSTIGVPTATGSGVNFVPLILPVMLAATATVEPPTMWLEPTSFEPEFVDSDESIENPFVVLAGETLLQTGLVESTAAVGLPTATSGPARVTPALVASASAVRLPFVVTPQTRSPQLVPSGADVRRPVVRPVVVRPVVPRPRAGAPAVVSPARPGVPVLRSGARIPA